LKKRTKKLLSAGARAGRPARVPADEVFFASFFFRKKKTLSSLSHPLGPARASG
jgi:hypothetical protein